MLEKMAMEFLISAFWELVDDEENTLDSSMVKSKKNELGAGEPDALKLIGDVANQIQKRL